MPNDITKKLMELMGYESLYPPQQMALEKDLENGKSLLIASPTASGKTFIALDAILNSLNKKKKRAIYTAPLRSIASQKYREFKRVEEMGYKVRLSIGDYEEGPPKSDILITTYERLDSIIRNSPNILNEIGSVVIDEVHYVDDEKRGPVLETLISKILYKNPELQIVALSATVPNAEEISKWINSDLVYSTWRPVPLYEGVYKDGLIKFIDGKTKEIETIAKEPSIDLIIDESNQGGQSLVFSQSRKRVVQLAKKSSSFYQYYKYDKNLAKNFSKKILSTNGPRSLREELSQLILKGVAYHHAGLSNEQRSIVEEAFERNAITAIFATPTLAAGVNLPARRVIVEEYYRFERGYRSPIKVSEYKQLAGRAGRPGLDPYGEAIIAAKKSDEFEDLFQIYIKGNLERLESKLSGLKGLRHSVLGAVASGIANDYESIYELHKKTLYYIQRGEKTITQLLKTAIKQLIDWELINEENKKLIPTNLGYVTSKTYLDPESIPILKNILNKIKKINETLILYIISSMPDINPFIVNKSEEDKIMDRVIEDAPELIDIIDWMGPDEVEIIKTMFVLKDWINEVSEDKISENYNIGPGDLASLTDNAKWVTRSLGEICEVLGLPSDVVGQFKLLEKRIENGVKTELLELVNIPEVGRVRARKLYNAGYKNLASLATANPKDLLKISGIGSSTVLKIMEYFNRESEVKDLKKDEE
ncbi:superfamily II helicase [Caldisphaera lagunensis DSM 15908]|uniref:ATP-dependent DNA helicase Hel308 n=1 Tax=Caldisphaera lagunensis (strain DSM 15908 / JCM 11604 / ANMR 0165 / IC-154) TaxID=1056495 RepID=L0A969_CALLD|nr:DEAD/DEAH box helicase [Caldisphaera lagunensis]AFZ70416.1 superfamily II helicase [Caldisphaera lagunensis DSM 15908]